MAEYIEREALIDNLNHFAPEHYNALINMLIEKQPAADVVEVKHGRWRITPNGAAYCTACKRKMNPSQYGYAFCSMCGAKMDGERRSE